MNEKTPQLQQFPTTYRCECEPKCGCFNGEQHSMSRKFLVTITDTDGEMHSYKFHVSNVWKIVAHIAQTMQTKGNFYGHHPKATMALTISELIRDDQVGSAPAVSVIVTNTRRRKHTGAN